MIDLEPDTFIIPRPRAAAALSDDVRDASAERQAVAPDFVGVAVVPAATKNILVAEDNDPMRGLIARSLRQHGYRVVEVRNGFELMHWVELIRRWNPITPIIDLIVTDNRMPMFTGLECLEQLQIAQVATPVILITAFGDRQLHHEALQQGARQVLDKPVAMPALCAAVDRLLQ